jgi:hypothetical protein
MRIPRSGAASVDRGFGVIQKALTQVERVCFSQGIYLGAAMSASFDAPVYIVKEACEIGSLQILVDTAVPSHASNYWFFRLVRYRTDTDGVRRAYSIAPDAPFSSYGLEGVGTDVYPLRAYVPLVIPCRQVPLEAGEAIVVEAIKNASALDLVFCYIQADFRRVA